MKATLRGWARLAANRCLRALDVRMVSASWGPRGFADALRRAAAAGVRVREVVDVGAANGSWTRDCMTVFPAARYLLVDALEENRRELEAFSLRQPNVRVSIGALGAEDAEQSFFVHGDQSSFYPSEYGRDVARARSLRVRTLDSYLGSELSSPDLIKADVQGHELSVLRGGRKCLASAQLVLLEVSFRRAYEGAPLAEEVFRAMANEGFRIFDICSYGQRPGDRELFQSDVLFAREGSPVFAYEGYAHNGGGG